jgi:hypothetical protein
MTANSSNIDNDDHELLGADQEEAHQAHASTHDAVYSSAMPQCRGGSLHSGIHSPASTRHNGRTTFQYKFILL